MQKRCSSGSYCLLGAELSKILLNPSSWGTHSRRCLNIKEEEFESGFTISSFPYWAVKHNQINHLLKISPEQKELLYDYYLRSNQWFQRGCHHQVLMSLFVPNGEGVSSSCLWLDQNLFRGQRLEILHTSPQRAIHLLSAQKTWLFLVRSYLNHCFSNFYAGSLISIFTFWFLFGLSILFHSQDHEQLCYFLTSPSVFPLEV